MSQNDRDRYLRGGALSWMLAVTQVVLGARVVWRLLRPADPPIRPAAAPPTSIGVVVPVLNEANRLSPCLDGLVQQGPEVREILVVDTGSHDGTCALAKAYTARDPRVRLLEAGPPPAGYNGKVWGLAAGEQRLHPLADWLLMLDADVRPAPGLAASLVARATERDVAVLSVATAQRIAGRLQGILHPALLATLVYRRGVPGRTTSSPTAVLANGQCCLIRRDLLPRIGRLDSEPVRRSLCEDVTLARLAARAGYAVGFYEAPGLVEASMYTDWREAWHNWPRSLVMRDAEFALGDWLGLLEVVLVQALPLWLMLLPVRRRLRQLNLILLAARIGVLAGMARAYPSRPWTYWLSPLADLPAAFALWRSVFVHRQTWRGRTYALHDGVIARV